jgi:hypothetical protein
MNHSYQIEEGYIKSSLPKSWKIPIDIMSKMNKILTKVAIGYSACFVGLGFGANHYVANIKEASMNPKEFSALVYSNPSQLFTRSLHTKLSLEELSKKMFALNLYKLEFLLSQTEFNDKFRLETGEKMGHITVESVSKNDSVVFRYLYPGFDYRLFMRKTDGEVQLGFVDYSGSYLQELGCRFYLPLLLEGLCANCDQ